MERIEQFKAADGTIFSQEKDCVTYERQFSQIEKIIKFMGPKPKDKGRYFAD